ncbi:MAG: hypothetical protein IT375_01805 [Polyangiaceae bacterium]|nr:hypothetical protein [Polyangiaceae bacterium]MCK6536540.1 hypothetical protein [Polyangiaceae bacterium]
MKNGSKGRRWTLGVLTLAGATYASIALAADQRLDDADAAVVKAIALLEAAENPGVTPPFGGHRKKAIDHLKKGRLEIAKSKAYADNPKNKPKPKPPTPPAAP